VRACALIYKSSFAKSTNTQSRAVKLRVFSKNPLPAQLSVAKIANRETTTAKFSYKRVLWESSLVSEIKNHEL